MLLYSKQWCSLAICHATHDGPGGIDFRVCTRDWARAHAVECRPRLFCCACVMRGSCRVLLVCQLGVLTTIPPSLASCLFITLLALASSYPILCSQAGRKQSIHHEMMVILFYIKKIPLTYINFDQQLFKQAQSIKIVLIDQYSKCLSLVNDHIQEIKRKILPRTHTRVQTNVSIILFASGNLFLVSLSLWAWILQALLGYLRPLDFVGAFLPFIGGEPFSVRVLGCDKKVHASLPYVIWTDREERNCQHYFFLFYFNVRLQCSTSFY